MTRGKRTWKAVSACERLFGLAEGPLWDGPRSRVLWVDIPAGRVFEGRVSGEDRIEITSCREYGDVVAAVVASTEGDLVVCGRDRVLIEAADGRAGWGPRLVPRGTASRLNDAAVDPWGRLVVGTLSLQGHPGDERLLRVAHDDVEVLDDDLGLSNGLAWSPDGTLLYSVDSLRRVVWVRDYGVDAAGIGERQKLIVLEDGLPDGLCVDSDGSLWLAVWGQGEVRKYTTSGEHVATVSVPAPHTSSVAFIGEGLDLLMITTARAELDDDQLSQWPQSGRLFTVRVDAVGLPAVPWRGRP